MKYSVVYYPESVAYLSGKNHSLPLYIEQEFEDFLKCGQLAHGFAVVLNAVEPGRKCRIGFSLDVWTLGKKDVYTDQILIV